VFILGDAEKEKKYLFSSDSVSFYFPLHFLMIAISAAFNALEFAQLFRSTALVMSQRQAGRQHAGYVAPKNRNCNYTGYCTSVLHTVLRFSRELIARFVLCCRIEAAFVEGNAPEQGCTPLAPLHRRASLKRTADEQADHKQMIERQQVLKDEVAQLSLQPPPGEVSTRTQFSLGTHFKRNKHVPPIRGAVGIMPDVNVEAIGDAAHQGGERNGAEDDGGDDAQPPRAAAMEAG
jgi:hypothetical protein